MMSKSRPIALALLLVVTFPTLCQKNKVLYSDNRYSITLSGTGKALALRIPKEEWDAYVSMKYYGQLAPYRVAGMTISTTWTRLIYSVVKDDFDFLLFIPNTVEKPVDLMGAFYQHVRNDVHGIGTPYFGTPLFDFTAIYGDSIHRLQGIIFYNHTDDLDNGPLLHELMHRWGNYILDTEPGQAHWGFADINGRLGGFSYFDKGDDGLITVYDLNHYYSGPYAPFELYLMGLITKEQVPPVTVLMHLPDYPKQVQVAQYRIQGIPATYTIDQIIQGKASNANQKKGLGERTPGCLISQKNFSLLTVVFDSKEIDTEVLDGISGKIDSVCSNKKNENDRMSFWEATGGRAQLVNSDLASHLRVP